MYIIQTCVNIQLSIPVSTPWPSYLWPGTQTNTGAPLNAPPWTPLLPNTPWGRSETPRCDRNVQTTMLCENDCVMLNMYSMYLCVYIYIYDHM